MSKHMGASETKNFKPISKKIRLRIDNRPKTPTIFTFQKGYVNDRLAIRFFKTEKKMEIVFKTLVSPKKQSWESKENISIWDVIVELGGQTPENARKQREECLMKICESYFKKRGYNVEFEPFINQKTPDVLVTKGKHACYIELKAYFSKTVVGEPEVAQTLKYYAEAQDSPEIKTKIEAKEMFPPKFMLIHSGKLIPFQENSLFNGDIKDLETTEKKIKFIDKKYRELVKQLGRPNNMESRDTRFIYYKAAEKLKKYYVEFEKSPNILHLNKPHKLDLLIESPNKHEVILIPSRVFSQILYTSNLKFERAKFNHLQNTWLERLMLDKSICEI